MPVAEVQMSLLCRAGGLLCALPVHHLVETLRLPPLEVLPAAPVSVLGVAIVRGSTIPVVGVSKLLGGEVGAPTRLVVAKVEGRHVGLAVDEVVGFRTFASGLLHSLPPLLSDASKSAVTEIATLDGALMVMLQTAHIVPDEVFAFVDARAVAS